MTKEQVRFQVAVSVIQGIIEGKHGVIGEVVPAAAVDEAFRIADQFTKKWFEKYEGEENGVTESKALSEDEKIRKALIELVYSDVNDLIGGVKKRLCVSYLEKQKEPFIIRDPDCHKRGTKMPEYCLNVKPAERKEEDEKKIESIKGLITMGKFVDTNTIRTIWKLLDSLRPQPYWKPSEEQIDALNSIILNGSFTYVGQVQDLISLKDDLKKLL